jgi:hypothetical protein
VPRGRDLASRTMTDTQEPRPSLDLKPREVVVGAVAALITALFSSVLGVAGTIGGAAVGSVLTTVSGSVLRHSAERTNDKLRRSNSQLRRMISRCTGWDLTPAEQQRARQAEPAAVGASTSDRPGIVWPGDALGVTPTQSTVDDPPCGAVAAPPAESSKRRWWVVGAATAAMFVLAIIGITSAEAVLGEPLSSLFGHHNSSGSSIGQVVSKNKSTDTDKTKPSTPATPGSSTSTGATTPSGAPGTATSAPADGTAPSTPAPPDPAGGSAGGDTGAVDTGAAGQVGGGAVGDTGGDAAAGDAAAGG